MALKAELLTKQAQVERARAAGINIIHHRGDAKKVKEPEKKNAGVDLRSKKDEEEKEEEEPSLEKVLHVTPLEKHILTCYFTVSDSFRRKGKALRETLQG